VHMLSQGLRVDSTVTLACGIGQSIRCCHVFRRYVLDFFAERKSYDAASIIDGRYSTDDRPLNPAAFLQALRAAHKPTHAGTLYPDMPCSI
jgi:hypothetical protein